MSFELPPIFPITDTRLSGLSHAEQVRRLIAGGATIVQLRDKSLAPREFYREAATSLQIARASGVPLIINDRVDIALALGADCVHLGQSDLAPEHARRLLGDEAIIGLSIHNLEQAKLAVNMPITYLAIGPIFATSTKKNPDPVVGLEGLRVARAATTHLPLVAIGGINRGNARQVIQAGADSVAVIGDLLARDSQIDDRMRQFLSLAEK